MTQTPEQLAESVKRIRETPNDRPDMMQTINALVEMVGEMHNQCLPETRGDGNKIYWSDKIDASLTKSSVFLAALKGEQVMENDKTTAPLTPYGEALTKSFVDDPTLDELSFKTGYLAAFEQPDNTTAHVGREG